MKSIKALGPWTACINRDWMLRLPISLVRVLGLRAGDTVVFGKIAGSTAFSVRFFRKRGDGSWLDVIKNRTTKRLPSR